MSPRQQNTSFPERMHATKEEHVVGFFYFYFTALLLQHNLATNHIYLHV